MSRIISRTAVGSCLILAASFHLLAAEKPSKESPADIKARQEVLAALQAEAAGDNDRRAEQLARAVASAPHLAEANWHLGRVHVAGQWLDLAAAERRASADPQIAEYRRLRDDAGTNPKLLHGLARWCVKAGWSETAKVHYSQVLAAGGIDRETQLEAVKRLDLHSIGGAWITGEEWTERQHKAKTIDEALARWRPRLAKLQAAIDGDDFNRRDHAIAELRKLDDPKIIPVLESFLVDGEDRFQEEAVKRLAAFPQIEATESLVHYAVLSPFQGARDAAAAALRTRSVFEYCPLLLGGLIAPIQLQFQFSVSNRGVIASTQAMHRETPLVNQLAVNDIVLRPTTALVRGLRPNWVDMQIMQNNRRLSLIDLQNSAAAAEIAVGEANNQAETNNRRIIGLLTAITGQPLGDQPSQWWEWWQDYNQKWLPQVSQFTYGREQRYYPNLAVRHSCFIAGTPIRTQLGLVPIETIRPGDLILSQDQDTGELAYKVIVATTIRPPGKLVRIEAGESSVTATLGHPFWVDGQGWRMAKDLTTADVLHSVGGPLPIGKIEELPDPQQAYNLVVDDFNTYFVGNAGLLVHDNEFRKPTRATVPGLAAEEAGSRKK